MSERYAHIDEHLLQELVSGRIGSIAGILLRWTTLSTARTAMRVAVQHWGVLDGYLGEYLRRKTVDGLCRAQVIELSVEHTHERLTLQQAEYLATRELASLRALVSPWMKLGDLKKEVERQIEDDERWAMFDAIAQQVGRAYEQQGRAQQ